MPASCQIVNIHDKTMRLETALSMSFIIHRQHYAARGREEKLVYLKAKTGAKVPNSRKIPREVRTLLTVVF